MARKQSIQTRPKLQSSTSLGSQHMQGLNSTFYSAFSPTVKDVSQLANVTGTILKQFNTSLAYNPFSQVRLCSHRACALVVKGLSISGCKRRQSSARSVLSQRLLFH